MEPEDTTADELQTLMHKIVAHKLEFMRETSQAPKHQYAHNLQYLYFRVIAGGLC